MNKEQQELLGDAFMRYYNSFPTPGKLYEYEGNATDLIKITKEEFINKIKTDDEFAKKWGSLGKIYGHGWRNWNGKSDDELYEDYLKKVKKD
jgi:thymidylate synthase